MASPLSTRRSDQRHLRVGDAERDGAVEALRDHYVAGRLDASELDERLDVALAARTRGDLDELFRDLPGQSPTIAAPARAAATTWWAAAALSFWRGVRSAPPGLRVVAVLLAALAVAVLVSIVAVAGLFWALIAWFFVASRHQRMWRSSSADVRAWHGCRGGYGQRRARYSAYR